MNVLVIGGGPAGAMAAATAAQNGHRTTLLEQNEKLGKKLYITGKGRCNVTNDCDRSDFFANIVKNSKFLYSAYSALSPQDLMFMLEELGVPLKTERGNRVFPASDKSNDILRAMQKLLQQSGVRVMLNTAVKAICTQDDAVSGVQLADGTTLAADAVILCTGGASYPSTGSTGDGYTFAKALGHSVCPPLPALVPLETKETWPYALSGLTLKNVTLTAVCNHKEVYHALGEMLFTHFGVSGPLVLSASSLIAENPAGTQLFIDLKPGLTHEQLDQRLLRDIDAARQKSIRNAFYGLLPQRLLPVVLAQAGIDPDRSCSEFSKAKRQALCNTLKALPLTVSGVRPFREAIITRGGIQVKEVNPSSMQSKLVKGLYFAGEVLDVDAFTGGFNLQIAWSTGRLAGQLK